MNSRYNLPPQSRRAFVAMLAAAPAAYRSTRETGQYYFVEDRASIQSLARNARQIPMFSPAWYAFDREGRLEETIGPVTAGLVKQYRLKTVPLVVNKGFDAGAAHAVIADVAWRKQAVQSLAAAAERHGYAGYELDFENFSASDRLAYVSFAVDLAHVLRKIGRTVSVSVGAPLLPTAPGSVYKATQASALFDYELLGQETDWLSFMAYDEHTQPDAPGPIASEPWVEGCLAYLTAAVPARKLKLGIPFYHRRWSARGVQAGSFDEAALLAEAYGVPLKVHPTEREISFRIKGAQGEEQIWMHGAESLRLRLELVQRCGLAGFAAWRLGQEDPAFWTLMGGTSGQ